METYGLLRGVEYDQDSSTLSTYNTEYLPILAHTTLRWCKILPPTFTHFSPNTTNVNHVRPRKQAQALVDQVQSLEEQKLVSAAQVQSAEDQKLIRLIAENEFLKSQIVNNYNVHLYHETYSNITDRQRQLC